MLNPDTPFLFGLKFFEKHQVLTGDVIAVDLDAVATTFREYQKPLLGYANSEAGRYLLGIKDDREIVAIFPNSYRFFNGFVAKDKASFTQNFYTWDRIASILLPILDKKELALENALRQHDDRLVRRIFENPYEAFLHFADLEIQNSKYPQIFLATDTFTVGNGSGRCGRSGAVDTSDWATVRNATVGTFGAGIDIGMIQTKNEGAGGSYLILRGYLPFDTSALPDVITSRDSGFLRLVGEGTAKINGSGETVHIVSETTASNTDVVLEDYDQVGGITFGSKTIADYVTTIGTNNDFTLNTDGLNNVSLTSFSKFGVRGALDLNNTAPGAGQDNEIRWGRTNAVLSFTYTSFTYTKEFNETITISDTLLKAVSKTFSETITLSEVFSTIHGYFKTFTETAITISDTFQKAIQKTFSEEITLSEVFAKTLTVIKTFSETITLSETFSKALEKTFNDVVSITDTIRKYLNGILVTIWTSIRKTSATWSKIVKTTTSFTKTAKPTTSYTKVEKPDQFG